MVGRPELSFINDRVAEFAKLRNAAALRSHEPRLLVEKPVSLVMPVANTEDIEICVTNEIFVFLEELSPDLSIPCRDVDVFVSVKGLASFLILRMTLGRILCLEFLEFACHSMLSFQKCRFSRSGCA